MERYERLHDDVDMDEEAELSHLEGDTALYPDAMRCDVMVCVMR